MAKKNHGDGTNASIEKFNFHGDDLDVVHTQDGQHWVVLARLCEPFELKHYDQGIKLKAAPWASTRIIRVVDPNGAERSTLCLNISSVAGWLFTLNPGKVAPHLRSKLIQYQKECADALADRFLGRRGGSLPSTVEGFAMAVGQVLGVMLPQALAPLVRHLGEMEARSIERHEAILRHFESVEKRVAAVEERVAKESAPGDSSEVGMSGAREICRGLRLYADIMANSDKAGMKSWRGSGETELRGRLGFSGAARTWRRLPRVKMGEARIALEEMLQRARKWAKTRNAQRHLFDPN